jgi:hypothetical protein
MVKVYQIGDRIPDFVKESVDKWDYCEYVVVANSTKRNNGNERAQKVAALIQPDDSKILRYRYVWLEIFVIYTFPQD